MKKLGLYIHLPFCMRKCLYCDFPSYSSIEKYMLDYTKALSIEIENKVKDKKVSTIFIGGGTPSYLSLEAWGILKNTLKNISKYEDCEFTVECNPGSFDEEKLALMKDIGVNRLSIGLQAYQDKLLEKLGRIHDLQQFLDGFHLARRMGFNNINIDLMFAIPNQTFQDWKETLNEVVKLNPEHISCYSLIIEEGTPFYNMYQEGKLNLPGEEIEIQMYEFTINFLKTNMYNQYEISNFAKEGRECRHNLIYWSMDDYIGCGASAHSYFNGSRNKNESSVEKYIEKVFDNIDPSVESFKNSIEDNIEEFMFLGLRKTNGISEEDFKFKFSKSIYDVYGDLIDKYQKKGLLKKEKGRIFLSQRGIEISNTIMSDFILT